MAKDEKNAELCRQWYARNRARKLEMQQRRAQDIQNFIDATKTEAGCRTCGERDPRCLSFHHRDGEEKLFDISIAGNGQKSMAALTAEIAKCDVLCMNCHMKHHWEERQQKKAARLTTAAGSRAAAAAPRRRASG